MKGSAQTELGIIGAPRALRYVRILIAIEVTRLLGLILFSGIQNGTLPSTAALFGAGDALVGITALPFWYALRRSGLRTYALTMAWVTFGLVDLIYAVIDATLGGQTTAIINLLGVGFVAVPFNIAVQLATFVLLLDKSVVNYLAKP